MRDQAAIHLDGLLVRVVRGQGAVDLAIGRDLLALSRGKLMNRLGYVRLGDYARERLGIREGTARELVRLSRGLGSRQLLREAVWSGEVEASKALTVLPVLTKENEAKWTDAARTQRVRELRRLVRDARGGRPPDDELLGAWERVRARMSPDEQESLKEALKIAREIEGAAAPKWVLLEALAAEFIGSFAAVLGDDGEDAGVGGQVSGNGASGQMSGETAGRRRATGLRTALLPKPWIDECCAWLNDWTEGWSFLDHGIPIVAGIDLPEEQCAFALDDRLQKLARMRDGWGELTGRLALLIKMHGLWRDMRFVSFRHYCNDRLSASGRAIEQRAWLERRFLHLPGLRDALHSGRINYSKALILGRTASPDTIAAQLELASEHTCKELRMKAEEEEERQMSVKGEVEFRAPEKIVDLLCDAIFAGQAVHMAAGLGELPAGTSIAWMADHFTEIWKNRTGAPRGKRKEILDRHNGLCSIPTCTLPAEQTHHVKFRSRGGGDEKENQTGLCRSHHADVHAGMVRVRGRVGERLVIEIGIRNGVPREVFVREK